MGLLVYVCGKEFPETIPHILRADGFTVSANECRKVNPAFAVERPFAFRVSDGKRILDITGGEEKDGTIVFMVAAPWTCDPLTLLGRRRFCDSVVECLLEAGAKVCVPEG